MPFQDPRTASGYSKNIVLPSGYLMFDPENAAGGHEGEIYLADTPGFTVNVTSDSLEVFDADGPLNELELDIATSVARSASLQAKDISLKNLEIFLIAGAAALTTTAAPVVAHPINAGGGVLQGRWYQLGVSATHPAGVREIDTLVVKDAVPTTYTITTDYIEDLVLGRIYIVPGGGIADGTVIASDYNTTAVSWDQVSTNSLGAKRGKLRFIAHNTNGVNRDLFAPNVVMKPDGDLVMKSRDAVQTLGFSVSIQKPADGSPSVYLNSRAA